MKVIEVKNYEEMSLAAAKFIIEKVKQKPAITLGLATGGTPEGTYKHLIEDHKTNGTTYKDVTTFNLDEYVGLKGDDTQSYRFYMNNNLFNHIDIDKNQTNVPNGSSQDSNKEAADYEAQIDAHGQIDLQLLGIGGNGHIGFNEPGTSFDQITHVVDLTPETIEANARYFDSAEEVPKKAISMGIASIMKAKEILLIASGTSKKEAIKALLCGPMTEDNPASILQKHPNVTIIADEEALSESKQYR